MAEDCGIRRGRGAGATQAGVVGRGDREGRRGRSLVAGGAALPGQCGSPVLRGGVAAIGHVPVQAGAARNHRSRPSQVTAQAGASGAGYCISMDTGSQATLVGSRVPAQAGAPWSGGHIAMEAWNLVGPCWVPAQTGAPWSGCCTALVAGNRIAMETRTRWTHHLAVAQTRTARGSHAGVDGSPAKTRTGGSVGTHCPVAGLGAPRYRVDTSYTILRPDLALWRGVELLK